VVYALFEGLIQLHSVFQQFCPNPALHRTPNSGACEFAVGPLDAGQCGGCAAHNKNKFCTNATAGPTTGWRQSLKNALLIRRIGHEISI